jgi:hypothetical protein
MLSKPVSPKQSDELGVMNDEFEQLAIGSTIRCSSHITVTYFTPNIFIIN